MNSGHNASSKHKLVFLGDQSVGKTSVINRFIYDTFEGKDHVQRKSSINLFPLLSQQLVLTSSRRLSTMMTRQLDCSSGILLAKSGSEV